MNNRGFLIAVIMTALVVVLLFATFVEGYRQGSVSCGVVASYIENQSRLPWLPGAGQVFVPVKFSGDKEQERMEMMQDGK